MLEEVPSAELRLLYKHARAVVCPSFAEGFDLSGVEAMSSGGVVIASDIPVHREVYADGARYFNPYSVEQLVGALLETIDPVNPERREQLLRHGSAVGQRYKFEAILPKWQHFLTSACGLPA